MKLRRLMLRLTICLLLTPVTAFALGNSNTPTRGDEKEAIEKEVLRLEEVGRQKILKGDNNWDDLIAEGCYMIAFDGSIIIYKQGIQLPSLPVKAFTMTEMMARYYGGEAVVVTGLAEVESETADKKPISFKMRFLNVWKKSGNSWKMVVTSRTGVRPSPAK